MDKIENSMCYDITSDAFDEELIGYKPQKYKAEIIIGNIKVYNTKHFNWVNRMFWKILLGIDIKSVDIEM